MIEDFFQIFGVVVLVIIVFSGFRAICKSGSGACPFDCIKHLSYRQSNKLTKANCEVNNFFLKNKDYSICEMNRFYLANIDKFDFDFSEEELEAFVNYLSWFYYDGKKGKIKKVRL